MKNFTLITAITIISTVSTFAGTINKEAKEAVNIYTTIPTEVNILSANDLKSNLRSLGETQVALTQKLMVCVLNNNNCTETILADLAITQMALGNSIKPFYGNKAGDKLTALMNRNTVIMNDLLASVKANDVTLTDEIIEAWKDNGAEIALFYSIINPAIKENNMRNMLFSYMRLTTLEGEAQLRNNTDNNLDIYNKISSEMVKVSDKLSNGIVSQFPEKFNTDPTMALAVK